MILCRIQSNNSLRSQTLPPTHPIIGKAPHSQPDTNLMNTSPHKYQVEKGKQQEIFN